MLKHEKVNEKLLRYLSSSKTKMKLHKNLKRKKQLKNLKKENQK